MRSRFALFVPCISIQQTHLVITVSTTGRRWSNVSLYHAANGEPCECDPRWRGSPALRNWPLLADNGKAVPEGAAFCFKQSCSSRNSCLRPPGPSRTSLPTWSGSVVDRAGFSSEGSTPRSLQCPATMNDRSVDRSGQIIGQLGAAGDADSSRQSLRSEQASRGPELSHCPV